MLFLCGCQEAAVVCHAAKEEHSAGGFRGECCRERPSSKAVDQEEELCSSSSIKAEAAGGGDSRATTPLDDAADGRSFADEEDSQASIDSTHRKRASRHSLHRDQVGGF